LTGRRAGGSLGIFRFGCSDCVSPPSDVDVVDVEGDDVDVDVDVDVESRGLGRDSRGSFSGKKRRGVLYGVGGAAGGL